MWIFYDVFLMARMKRTACGALFRFVRTPHALKYVILLYYDHSFRQSRIYIVFVVIILRVIVSCYGRRRAIHVLVQYECVK